MDQDIIYPKVTAKNKLIKAASDDSFNPLSLFSQGADANNTFYINSILKIPQSHSIKYDKGSISKQMVEADKQVMRISDFSTKGSQFKKSPPYKQSPNNLNNNESTNIDITQWGEASNKPKPVYQNCFRPISKPQTMENIEEINNDYFDDFECSMEEAEEIESLKVFETLAAPEITFISSNQNQYIKNDENRLVILKHFVDKLQNRNNNFKIYTCDICNKNFNNHAALGGHKAKNHPHSSKSFIERKKTFELRKSERKKREFLRNF